MKRILAIAAIVAFAATAAQADLGAWWSFNNSYNYDRGDGYLNGSGYYHTTVQNSPYDDGVWSGPAEDKMGPVFDGYNNTDPGVLVDDAYVDGTISDGFVGYASAHIDVSNLVGENDGSSAQTWGSYSGTSTNRPDGGTFGGGSLAIVGDVNNGSFFDIVITDSLYQVDEVSWAQKGTSTGFNSRAVQYSTDNGLNFTTLAVDTATLDDWEVKTYDFSAISGVDVVRVAVDGTTSTNGNNRFDNIQLQVSEVPEPATMALLGLGGIAAVIRRRRA
jgi:hypothetical protein